MRICEFVIRIRNKDRVHAHRKVRICWVTQRDLDVVFSSRCGPKPEEHQRQSADILCNNAAVSPTGDESFSVKYPEPHPRSTTTSPGQIQRLDNIRRPLPVITFSLDRIQA